MGWSEYQYPGGSVWNINYSNVANVIKAYAYMVALSENVRIEEHDKNSYFSYESYRMCRSNILMHNEVQVKSRAKTIAQNMYQAFLAMLSTADIRRADSFLAGLRVKTLRLRKEHGGLVDKSNEMNRRFLQQANRAVTNAMATRDTSIILLTVIASVTTGGTAAAAATLSTGGSALAKYQDTGDFGQAAKAGVGTVLMLGWGQFASFAKGMQVSEKAIFFTLGAGVDFSTNVMMNSDQEFDAAVSSAAWTTLRNAGFFWLDVGMQHALASEIGIMGRQCNKEMLRFLMQGTGRLFEKAILDDMAKEPIPRSGSKRLPQEVQQTIQMSSTEAINYIRSNCMYRVR